MKIKDVIYKFLKFNKIICHLIGYNSNMIFPSFFIRSIFTQITSENKEKKKRQINSSCKRSMMYDDDVLRRTVTHHQSIDKI